MAAAVLLLLFHILVSGYVCGASDSELTLDHVLYSEEYEIEGDLEDSLLFKRLANLPLEVPSEVPFSGTVRATGNVVILGHFGIDDIFGLPMHPEPQKPVYAVTPRDSTKDVVSTSQSNICPTCGTKCSTSCTHCPNCGTRTSDLSTICPNCGTRTSDLSTICPNCGTKCLSCGKNCPNCGTSVTDESAICPRCGTNCGTSIGNVIFCPSCGTNCAYLGTKCPNCGAECSHCPNCGARCPTTVPFSGLVPASGTVTISADFNDCGVDQLLRRQDGSSANLPKPCSNQKLCPPVPVPVRVTSAASPDNCGKMVEYTSASSTQIPTSHTLGLPATFTSQTVSSPSQTSNCPCMKCANPAPCKTPVLPTKPQDYSPLPLNAPQHRVFSTTASNPQSSPNQFVHAPHLVSWDLPWNPQLSGLPQVNLPQSERPAAHQSHPIQFEHTLNPAHLKHVLIPQEAAPRISAAPIAFKPEPISFANTSPAKAENVLKPQLTPMNIRPATSQLPTYLPSSYSKRPVSMDVPPFSFPWGIFQLTSIPLFYSIL